MAHLITEHEQLIGTNSTDGYFWIETKSEFLHADAELTSRVGKIILRRSGLRRGWLNKTQRQEKLFESEVV